MSASRMKTMSEFISSVDDWGWYDERKPKDGGDDE